MRYMVFVDFCGGFLLTWDFYRPRCSFVAIVHSRCIYRILVLGGGHYFYTKQLVDSGAEERG